MARPAAALIAALALGGAAAWTFVPARGPVAAHPFAAAVLGAPARVFSPAQMQGEVWVLNLWASWCGACRAEHPRLAELARAGVSVVGLNHRDREREALAWLAQLGDPFTVIAADPDGKVAAGYGVRALPATLVIDRRGAIRHRHDGALTRAAIERDIVPLVRRLEGER